MSPSRRKKLRCRPEASTRCARATETTAESSWPPPIPRPAPGEARSVAAAPIVCDAMLLAHLFERIISIGRLRVVDADGRSFAFEGSPGTSVAIRFHDPGLHWKLLVRPRLFLPEAYVDGTLTIEEGSLYDLIDLMSVNLA